MESILVALVLWTRQPVGRVSSSSGTKFLSRDPHGTYITNLNRPGCEHGGCWAEETAWARAAWWELLTYWGSLRSVPGVSKPSWSRGMGQGCPQKRMHYSLGLL